jgi:antitoxin (DNA-binding transcriptional repressor) of toxin-antitoxin stability system
MTVSIEQAQLTLKQLIEKTFHGETIVITHENKPVAELRAVLPENVAPVFGSCKGMLTVVADDEEHLKDFAGYMK